MQGRDLLRAGSTAVGMAFFWLFLRSEYFGILLRGDWSQHLRWIVSFALPIFMSVIACLACVAVRKDVLCANQRMLVVGLGAVGSLGMLLIRVLPADGTLALIGLLLCAVMVATAFVVLVYSWGYAVVGAGRVGLITQATGILLSFLFSIAVMSWNVATDVLSIGSPLASGLFWASVPRKGPGAKEKMSLRGSAATIALFALFLVAAGVVRGACHAVLEEPGHGMFQRLMSVALAVMILVALVAVHGRSSGRALAAVWSLVAFVFLVGLLILGYRGAEGYVLGADIIVMARVFLAFLFWLTLASIAHTRRVSPALLFGLCFCLTEAISWFLGYFGVPLLVAAFGIDLSGYVGVMSVGLLAALVAAVLLLAASLGFGAGQLVSGAAAMLAEVEAVSREQACARFAERCKLTPRESEVMLLISRGHSFERIAEQLVVSTGTIQTHVKNLYRKTGLHSKQEIIDAVDREVAELAQATPET